MSEAFETFERAILALSLRGDKVATSVYTTLYAIRDVIYSKSLVGEFSVTFKKDEELSNLERKVIQYFKDDGFNIYEFDDGSISISW